MFTRSARAQSAGSRPSKFGQQHCTQTSHCSAHPLHLNHPGTEGARPNCCLGGTPNGIPEGSSCWARCNCSRGQAQTVWAHSTECRLANSETKLAQPQRHTHTDINKYSALDYFNEQGLSCAHALFAPRWSRGEPRCQQAAGSPHVHEEEHLPMQDPNL